MYKYGGNIRDLRPEYAPISDAEARAKFAYFRKAETNIYLGPEIRPRNPQPICGTYSGWSKHKRDQEEPCQECKRAQVTYQRQYRAKKRAA